MNPSAIQTTLPPPHRPHHFLLALSAFLISTVAHLVTLQRLADLRLDTSAAVLKRRSEAAKRPPLQVRRLPADPYRQGRSKEAVATAPGLAAEHPRVPAEKPDSTSPLPPGPDPAAAGLAWNRETEKAHPPAPLLLPRQEIRAVLEKRVADELAALPRREVALIERVSRAPDFTPAADLAARRFSPAASLAGLSTAGFSDGFPLAGDFGLPDTLAGPSDATPAVLSERFSTNRDDNAAFVPLDDRLAVSLLVYRGAAQDNRLFFRVAIRPRDDRDMPVLARDIILVQDASASLAEERLHFCRKAMIAALDTIGPQDRFNVIGFNDRPYRCFPGWESVRAETTNAAARFISALHADGETDLYASLREILNLPRDPGRPVIACVISDGRPTAGVTESSAIIAEFTRLNNGAVSVYTFGTHGRANTYLLDLLTYCNRGSTRINRSGRWDIPSGVSGMVDEIRRPVMHDIRFAFDVTSESDVHPRLTSNLYLDRTLELFGSCPSATREIVFQLRGQAGGRAYDAIFRLDVARDGRPGDASIRERWAWQKMYNLISAYAIDPRRLYMAELYRLNRDYGVPILYQKEGFVRQPAAAP